MSILRLLVFVSYFHSISVQHGFLVILKMLVFSLNVAMRMDCVECVSSGNLLFQLISLLQQSDGRLRIILNLIQELSIVTKNCWIVWKASP